MSKSRFCCGLLVVLLLAGCAQDDGATKPDELIPADKMARILTEIHLAESQVSRYSLRTTDSSGLVFDRLNTRILKRFAVDTSAYRESYIYYSSHPDQLEAIYKEVTAALEKLTKADSTSAAAAPVSSGSATQPKSRRPLVTTTSL